MENEGFQERLPHRNTHTAGDSILRVHGACLVFAILHLAKALCGAPGACESSEKKETKNAHTARDSFWKPAVA